MSSGAGLERKGSGLRRVKGLKAWEVKNLTEDAIVGTLSQWSQTQSWGHPPVSSALEGQEFGFISTYSKCSNFSNLESPTKVCYCILGGMVVIVLRSRWKMSMNSESRL